MLNYHPQVPPDPLHWLEAGEAERIEAVVRWHRTAGEKLPNIQAHAIFHVIVENQIAEGLDAINQTVSRLMREGLQRHDALHAVASVLASHLHVLMKPQPQGTDPADSVNARYFAEVERLTAKRWRRSLS